MTQATSRLIFIISAIVALGPLSIDLYLPAMPSMVTVFGTSVDRVQLTLSSYLLGFAFFHLVCGPLSDRYGRKPILLGGLGIYVLMSMLCALSDSIEELIIFRFFQAMGACCAPTLGRAVVRDVFPPDQAVKALAYVSSLMALAPVAAPSIGGLLLLYGDWSLMFWALALCGVFAMVLVIYGLPESLPEKQSLHPKQIARNYLTLLKSADYIGNVLTAACMYASIFAFLSGASFVLITFMGVKAEHFGFYFVFIVVGYIGGNLFTARIGYRWPSRQVFRIGIFISCGASFLMVVFCLMQWFSALFIVVPVAFVAMAVGIVMPNATAEALRPFSHMAATASALMGFIQMGAAAISGWLVGIFLQDSPLPMALVIFGTGCCAMLCYWLILPNGSRKDNVC